MTTEEKRIEVAEEAGRNVAAFEFKSGYMEPRSWEKDGDPFAGVYSHLAAVGFSKLGCRMYAITFRDAYVKEFERLMKL